MRHSLSDGHVDPTRANETQYTRWVAKGAADERAKIVAWIRREYEGSGQGEGIADEIEGGCHDAQERVKVLLF